MKYSSVSEELNQEITRLRKEMEIDKKEKRKQRDDIKNDLGITKVKKLLDLR